MAERKRKVLLLGATGYQRTRDDLRVECCDWNNVADIKNIRDFDTIILDLLPLGSLEIRDTISWAAFFQQLDFAGAMDILGNGGAFIIIGDPRFSVRLIGQGEEEITIPFLHWTGIVFAWDSAPGDTVVFKDEYAHRTFADYISRLDQWEYSLSACNFDAEKLSDHFNQPYLKKNRMSIRLNSDKFCTNRYANSLAFSLRCEVVREEHGSTEVLQRYGPIIFLPKVALSHDEMVQRVLTDMCGIETDLPEPEWINEFQAPGQKAIDEEIRCIQAKIQSAVEDLAKANGQKDDCRKCLKLLYEREFALEPVVRDILRGLGAHVEDPTEKNKEDGWIVVKVGERTYEGVLEIKSTRSDTFSEDGRKQLLDWIDRGRTLRSKNYKGLFIGNSSVDKPIGERAWAFPDNWMKSAELSHICAFNTEDLYVFHLLNARGQLNLDEFWREVFETNGVLDMRKYSDALAPKEKSSK